MRRVAPARAARHCAGRRSRRGQAKGRAVKLIIQIPCYNEAEQLPATLAELPRDVPGFSCVEWLVIDDGSEDGTAEVARARGVDHVVRLPRNRGLAAGFMAGLEAALRAGADVIVNTDADNQYDAACIPDLTAPILRGEAQMVVGRRPIAEIAHFSPLKKLLQRLGSWAVQIAAGIEAPDAPSGFRAIHRDAAVRLYVFNRHTYTLETLIQAGRLGIPVAWVPIRTNPPTRPSRLIRSVAGYVWRSAAVIVRVFALYNPLRFFGALAALFLAPGVWAFGRFAWFWAAGDGAGHVQSLAIGSGLMAVGGALAVGGLLADMAAANRTLLAELRSRQLLAELPSAERRN